MHIYIRSMSWNILCSPRLHFGQTAGYCKVDMASSIIMLGLNVTFQS